jgi:porin
VTGGIGFRFKSHDILGVSLNWTHPPDGALRDQYTAEAYYRFNLTEHLAVTPDLQWVINPSLNTDVGSLIYFGLRA